MQMTPLGQVQWKHVAIVAGATVALTLIGYGVKKYLDSKAKKK